MAKTSKQEKLIKTTLKTIEVASSLPMVKVDKEKFLREIFGKEEYIETILKEGPDKVYSVNTLRNFAEKTIMETTKKTSIISFAAGLPSNIIAMIPAASADVVQFFGYAINLAQKIAYIYGEDELVFTKNSSLSEEAKIRIVAYLGVMLGATQSTVLVKNMSEMAGKHLGKKVAEKTLTHTTWYPIFKKVAASIGLKISKKTVGNTVAKAVPVLGAMVSGGITYFTFKPMGIKLSNTFAKNLSGEYEAIVEYRPEFKEKMKKNKE